MVDFGLEVQARGFERVVGGESQGEIEEAALVTESAHHWAEESGRGERGCDRNGGRTA